MKSLTFDEAAKELGIKKVSIPTLLYNKKIDLCWVNNERQITLDSIVRYKQRRQVQYHREDRDGKYCPLTIQITETLRRQLDAACKAKFTSKTRFVCKVLTEFFEEKKEAE